MIESGVGIPSPAQVANLATLAIMLKAAYSLDEACSPKVKSSPQVKPKGQAELLGEFAQLPIPLQRGCLKYAREMAGAYSQPPEREFQ